MEDTGRWIPDKIMLQDTGFLIIENPVSSINLNKSTAE
jgi:hypothetical protein